MNQAEVAAILYGIRGLPDKIWDRLEAERECAAPDQQMDFEDGLFAVTGANKTTRVTKTVTPPSSQPTKTNRWKNRK
jgi:hypothetical protein